METNTFSALNKDEAKKFIGETFQGSRNGMEWGEPGVLVAVSNNKKSHHFSGFYPFRIEYESDGTLDYLYIRSCPEVVRETKYQIGITIHEVITEGDDIIEGCGEVSYTPLEPLLNSITIAEWVERQLTELAAERIYIQRTYVSRRDGITTD